MKALRHVVGMTIAFVALAVAFISLTALGLVLHADLPAAKRIARMEAEGAIDGAIRGRVVINRLDRLGAFGVKGVDLELQDPDGGVVMRAEGVAARLDASALLASLIRRRAPVIRVKRLDVGRALVVVSEDLHGDVTLARAIASRSASASVVEIPSLAVRVAQIRGGVRSWPAIDLDLADVVASIASGPNLLAVRSFSAAIVDRTGTPRSPAGILGGSFEESADGIEARLAFEGRVGAVATSVRASLNRDLVDVSASARAAPGVLASLDSRVAEEADLDASLQIHGRVSSLSFDVAVHAAISGALLDGVASLTVDAPTKQIDRLDGHLDARGLDLAHLVRGAPSSEIAFVSRAIFERAPSGEPRASITLGADRPSIAGRLWPALRAEASLDGDAIAGVAHFVEPGARADVRFDARSTAAWEPPRRVHVTLDAEAPSLARFDRTRGIAVGAARSRIEASIDLAKREVDANGIAWLTSFAMGPFSATRAHVNATLRGALDHPALLARVDGADVRIARFDLGRVAILADGALDALRLEFASSAATLSIDGGARLRLGDDDARLEDTSLHARRADVEAAVQIATLHLARGIIAAEGVVIRGLGAPASGSIRLTPSAMAVHLHADGLDAHRLAKLFGRPAIEGSVHVALDLEATRLAGRGVLALDLVSASVDRLRDVNAHLVAVLEGRDLRGEMLASASKIGSLEIKSDRLALAGGPLSPRSWSEATGETSIDARADLAAALAAAPPAARPFAEASGALAAHAVVSRRDARRAPNLRLIASTDRLEITARPRRGEPIGASPPPWSSKDLDVRVELALDGEADHAELSAELLDPRGSLAVLRARVRSPLERLRGRSDLLAVAAATPIDVRLRAPRRSLEGLPLLLAGAPLRGEVALAVDVTGTALEPRVDATLAARGLFATEGAIADFASAPPIDAVLRATYDQGRAAIHGALATDGRAAVLADVTAYASVEDLLAAKPRWSASGRARFDGLEVGLFGPFARRHVRGRVDGVVELRDLHNAASLLARLDLSDLMLGQARFPHGSIRAKIEGGVLHAAARLDQSNGFGEARATAGVAWGASLTPVYAAGSSLDVHVHADRFRAAALAPLVTGTLSELDGRVDGAMWVHVERDPELCHADGALQIRDGAMESPLLGQEIRDVSARVVVRPWGTVRVEDFSASGWTGRLTGAAIARFQGTQLAHAEASVHVAESDAIPLSAEGVPLGDAWGDVEASVDRASDGRSLDVDVRIPTFHLQLPRATGNTVQPLDPDPSVRAGVFTSSGFVALPLEPPDESRSGSALATRAQIDLGDDVVLTRERTLEVMITGRPTVEVDGRLHISGAVSLAGGSIEVQSKRFTIDGGTVNFTGRSPSDPIIFATAHWDAPDGTRVFAEYRGPVRQGDLVLRSEPPRTRDDIVALILFGSAGGSLGATPPAARTSTGAAETAGTLAAAPITQGINKAISGITRASVSTRIDTSRAGNPRPELTIQLSKRLSATLSYNLGVPPPGDDPDRTQLTLDLRVRQRWAIDTMIGDRGSTSLDVIWRFRY